MFIHALVGYVAFGCAGLLALVAGSRARGSPWRWPFVAGIAILGCEAWCAALAAQSATPAEWARWEEIRHQVLSLAPLPWLAFSLTYARAGRPWFSREARLLLAVAAFLPLAGIFIHSRGVIIADARLETISHVARLRWGGVVLHALILFAGVVVLANLERTFRASVGTLRWRIKFMLLGVAMVFVAHIYTSSQTLVFRAGDGALSSIPAAALIIATPLILRSLFRLGSFDLAVYPSRAVLQSTLTMLLVGGYLVIVGILANLVPHVGASAFALKAFLVLIALVTLGVLLQSDHARLRLRTFVSRHFQRPAYDYRAVWAQFAEKTGTSLHPAEIAAAVIRPIADVFQCLSVSLWLVQDGTGGLRLAASTGNDGNGEAMALDVAAVEAHCANGARPIDLDTSAAGWSAVIRERHPRQFPHGGHRICLPLHSRGRLLGLIVAGDRVGGVPWSTQDFEMFTCIAGQVSASLMNAELSRRLVQGKELEAFQAMAAFCVHDLKNAASTLSLMLQNLPVHFENPEFRADALRGIEKTVGHINRLIGRLSQLRRELTLDLVAADLNEVVASVLAGRNVVGGAQLVTDFQPVGKIPLDREQMQKVVENLVLNAAEAAGARGRLRVATAEDNGWVVLTVEDNGCGMSREFMTQSLFRPFQTSKKHGLGIGMFQSKTIVDAHGGRIKVESAPGKGTQFKILLRGAGPVENGRRAPDNSSLEPAAAGGMAAFP